MARPTKQGVDYFPLDVHMDDKFKFIEIKYKLEGFAIVIKLMQRIYANGYFCNWTDDELLLFSDEIRISSDVVEGVVNECLERDIFNNELYKNYNILTSKGIQKRYKEIVRRRKGVDVNVDYLLVDNNFGVNDDILTTPSKHNDSKSTQSKVKESKVNKKRYKDYVFLTDKEYERLIKEYSKSVVNSKIEDLDNYLGSIGKTDKYKDHNRTIRAWLKRDGFESKNNPFVKKDELLERKKELEDSLAMPDDYYQMNGDDFNRDEVKKELNKVEQQLRVS